jgi:hypothetical protein
MDCSSCYSSVDLINLLSLLSKIWEKEIFGVVNLFPLIKRKENSSSNKKKRYMPELYAVCLVGIPELKKEHLYPVVENFISILKKKCHVQEHILFGNEVNYSNVKKELHQCAEYLKEPNRKAIVFYHGHGDQTPDKNGDEDDGMDEYWKLMGGGRMLDDEISAIFNDISDDSYLILINDNCSSGTMIDKKLNDRPWVCLSSCQDPESALASRDGGIFTNYGLLPGLETSKTMRELYSYITRNIDISTQHPMLTLTRNYLWDEKIFK